MKKESEMKFFLSLVPDSKKCIFKNSFGAFVYGGLLLGSVEERSTLGFGYCCMKLHAEVDAEVDIAFI